MKKLFAFLLAAVMVMALVACGGGTKEKYVAKSANLLGFESSWEELGGEECYIELSSDGTLTFHMDGSSSSGTYTVNGEAVTYTVDGDTATGTKSGNTLTMDYTYSDPDFGDITMTITFEKK